MYAIGNFGTKILSFLIVPLYTYYISPSEMGDYDLLNTTISLLTPIITLQISDGAYAFMIRNISESKKYIVAVYKFVFFASLFSAVIIIGVNSVISIPYVWYFVALLLTGRWMQTLQKLLRGLKNQKLFAISGIAYTAIFLLLNLLQIVVFKQGVDALFQSAIIANIVVIILIFAMEKRLRILNLNAKLFSIQKNMLRYSVPLIPNQLNWWVINSSDRYIIRFFLGSAANGVYAIAYKFPSLLQLIYNIFYQSWQDMSISDNEEDGGGFYTKVFQYYYKWSFSFLLFLIPFTKIFISLVMETSYQDAVNYISFLYLGTVFQAFSSFFGVGYLKNNKTSQAATTSIYGAIINAVIHIVLIHYIGLYAAAISTLVGFFVMFIVRVIQTKEIMKVRINWTEFYLYFICALFITILCVFTNFMIDSILTAIGCLLFVIINMKDIKLIIVRLSRKIKK